MKLCIFGAGRTGKDFIEKKRYELYSQYTEIFFTDSDTGLWDTEFCGTYVKNSKYIDEGTDVIIASMSYWKEIFQMCHLKKFQVTGIYDMYTEQVYSYQEMCRLKKTGYMNGQFIEYYQDKRERIDTGMKNFLETGELMKNVSEVAIMLSNLCNYANIHRECPSSCVKQKEILPSKVFFKVIDELVDTHFAGTICFHIYNEPLIDPRLFWFIDHIKKVLPCAKVEVYSNGYYLNDQMSYELKTIGTDILIVTGYGEKEYNRLMSLNVDLAYYVLYGNLDERLEHYNNREEPVSFDICKNYFTQVPIFSNGDIGICCMDYKHEYGIGNIFNNSLQDVLNSKCVVALQRELLKGNRSMYAVCKNCNWTMR